jgi:hypothetical protein
MYALAIVKEFLICHAIDLSSSSSQSMDRDSENVTPPELASESQLYNRSCTLHCCPRF